MKWQTFVAWILIIVIGGIISYLVTAKLKEKQGG